MNGTTGATGPTGPQGPTGAAGANGADGAAGSTGAAGATGAQGPTGAQGLAGQDGQKGDQGSAGPTGQTGAAGPTGAAGQTGAQGPAGVTGAAGAKGESGPQGLQGVAGEPGAPADTKNECLVNNGGCEGRCINTLGGYYCACDAGFSYVGQTQYSVKDCDTGSVYCDQYAGATLCYCTVKWNVVLLNGTNCTDVNECATANGKCDQQCTNTYGSYYCSCRNGYRLEGDYVCEDINECLEGSAACSHECVNVPGGYYCNCPSGTRRNTTTVLTVYQRQVAVQSCNGFPLSTSYVGSCTQNSNGCVCNSGSQTALVSATGGCFAANVTCGYYDHDSKYECYCSIANSTAQYIRPLNGTQCSYHNACIVDNGGCEHVCSDRGTGVAVCSCRTGFYLSGNQVNCEDTNECINRTFVDQFCPSPKICINTVGSYQCLDLTAFGKSAEIGAPAAAAMSNYNSPIVTGVTAWAAIMTVACAAAVGLLAFRARRRRASAPEPEAAALLSDA